MQRRALHPEHGQVNEAAALAALDGNRELLSELAQMFCEDAPLVLEDLRKALDKSNAIETRRAVHSLKGLASTFFATAVIELAQRLEHEAAAGNLTALKTSGANELSAAMQDLIDELVVRQLARGN